MKFVRWIAALAALSSAPATAQVRERISIGAWDLTANYQSGAFANCAMEAPYGSTARVTFMVTSKGAFGLGVRNQAWSLNAGNRANVTYWIDNGARRSRLATAVNQKFLLVVLDESSVSAFQELRLGQVMRLNTGSNTYTLTLKGTKSALDALSSCYQRHK